MEKRVSFPVATDQKQTLSVAIKFDTEDCNTKLVGDPETDEAQPVAGDCPMLKDPANGCDFANSINSALGGGSVNSVYELRQQVRDAGFLNCPMFTALETLENLHKIIEPRTTA